MTEMKGSTGEKISGICDQNWISKEME